MKKIKIYTKDYCPYCQSAKNLLEEVGARYEEIDLTNTAERMEALAKKSGLWTVPQIFADEKCLGGFDDIHRLHKEGRLIKELGV